MYLISLDFLNGLKNGCCGGGGGCYWYIMKYFMYLQVMVGKKYWYVMYYMYFITYQYFFKFEYNSFAWD
jgi:hypothetical protein